MSYTATLDTTAVGANHFYSLGTSAVIVEVVSGAASPTPLPAGVYQDTLTLTLTAAI